MDTQNSGDLASQDILEALQRIDPLPLPDDESRRSSLAVPVPKSPKPAARVPTFGSSLGLSGGGHSSVYYRTDT
jgi:hypothetical protein